MEMISPERGSKEVVSRSIKRKGEERSSIKSSVDRVST